MPPLLTHLVAEAARLDSHLPDNREKKRLNLTPIQLENGIIQRSAQRYLEVKLEIVKLQLEMDKIPLEFDKAKLEIPVVKMQP